MKKYFLNCQAKGGTGKSMLTNLQARKNEDNPQIAFIDLDSSTKTSSHLLEFLVKEEHPDRLFAVDIFDEDKKIERQRLLKVLEAFNQKDFKEVYIDFGAPESEQLPALLKLDFTADEFKDFEAELDAKFIFNVLVCGGTSYAATFEYLKELLSILEGKFDTVVYANMSTFKGYDQQLDQLNNYVKKVKLVKKIIKFGDIEVGRESGRTIMNLIHQGVGKEGFKNEWMARTKMKRLLSEI